MNKYQAVENVVYKHLGIDVANVKLRNKKDEYILPKHITWYFIYKLCGITYAEIGIHYGGKNPYTHSSVMSAVNKIKAWCQSDKDFKHQIDVIEDLARKKLGIRLKLMKARFGTRTSVTVNIYTCPRCNELIYTNKEKGYCTQCGTHLKFEV